MKTSSLRKECPYSEFFWSVFSPNAVKYGPEKLTKAKLNSLNSLKIAKVLSQKTLWYMLGGLE